MKPNVSSIDRALRIIVGLGLIGWGVYAHNWLGAIGIAPLLTGLIRFCPAYTLLGISTCKSCCGGGDCNKK
jgi:hypothetical protein